jgi:hypothetical protein
MLGDVVDIALLVAAAFEGVAGRVRTCALPRLRRRCLDGARGRAATRTGTLFYLPAYTKIDMHVVGTTAFDRLEFERRRRVFVGASRTKFVKTPENTVLRKLLWFEQGGRASSKQWRDVVEVLRVSGHVLDDTCLDDWAARVGVTPLLVEARAAAKKPPEPA